MEHLFRSTLLTVLALFVPAYVWAQVRVTTPVQKFSHEIRADYSQGEFFRKTEDGGVTLVGDSK